MAISLLDGAGAVQGVSMEHEQKLVSRIRSGDVAAFEIVYQEFAPRLLQFGLTQLRSRELAEELVQELFLNVWRHRADWVLTRSLNSYLFSALRNGITSYRRTTASRHELRQADDDTSGNIANFASAGRADDLLDETELLQAIDRAVAALPRRCRETFLLVRQQQLSYAEAAELMGVSVKAVEMNMVRAFAGLRKQLADWQMTRGDRNKKKSD
ncbi:MAG TPA: sigma-70 family RNA polymerase sigma factor [Gemmatimonadaceae bacterium]|jgi:RNA polymerase sigma-70 factor (ECF subfamily)|nr:sigma-70 family RNA polymerase sigma factor [Gemmatimonadaceae bacterium]